MKRNKYHIVQTWLLLLCFVAGQYMVYAHNHGDHSAVTKSAYHHTDTQPKQTVTENCQLCDAMHHNSMATASQAYFAPVVVSLYFYKTIRHNLISVKLVRSAGRSPPIS